MSHPIVLAGNNAAAVRVLDLLLGVDVLDKADILCIAPPGPPRHGWQVSLSRAAAERGVRCLIPADVNDEATVAAVRAHDAKLLLSVYYTQLFGPELLAAVDGPALNFHPSLLPRHRGTAPVIHAIAEGDELTGLSVHHIAAGVDTGELVWQRPIPIARDDTGHVLHRKLEHLVVAAAADLMRRWLRDGTLPPSVPQQGEPTIHRSTDPPLNAIDLTAPRERVRNVIRALAPPLPGAWVEHAGARLILRRAEPVEAPPRPAGSIDEVADGELLLWATDGALRAEVAA